MDDLVDDRVQRHPALRQVQPARVRVATRRRQKRREDQRADVAAPIGDSAQERVRLGPGVTADGPRRGVGEGRARL